jgi:hypothetical protein
MKNYSKSSAHKGKTAYRTPSRWLATKGAESFKKQIYAKQTFTKLWSTKRSALRGGKGK